MSSAPLMTGTTRNRDPSLRSTSTASPRLIRPGSTRYAWPSISVYAWLIERCSLAASTIAQPMRWVKLTLRGAICPFSSFRRASRVATSISRKLVAVGTPRLAVMFCASRAAGPLIGVAPSGSFGAGLGSAGAASVGASAASARLLPLPAASAGAAAGTGSNPPAPESNSERHSGSTLAGSCRYRSYRSATYPALTRFSSSVGSFEGMSPSRIRARRSQRHAYIPYIRLVA